MPTTQQAGTPTNRERQVDSAYNDPEYGYIPVLQSQINSAVAAASEADKKLQLANLALVTLKSGLNTIKAAGFSTAGIAPIRSYVLNKVSLGGTQAAIAQEIPAIALPAMMSIESADAWINQANSLLANNQGVYWNEFNAAKAGGITYLDGTKKTSISHDTIVSFYVQSFGQMTNDLKAAIGALIVKMNAYSASLLAAQAAVDNQETVIADAKSTYETQAKIVTDLNKQMTQLRLQYVSDLAAAQGVDAETAQRELQLQLASNPEYQAAIIEQQNLQSQQRADLAEKQLEEATDLEQTKVEAATNLQLEQARIAAAAQAATLQANIDAQNEANRIAADGKKTTMIIAAVLVLGLVFGIIVYMMFRKD